MKAQKRRSVMSRSLGMRIALSYAGFMARTLLGVFLAFSAVYWIAVCVHASAIMGESAETHAGEALVIDGTRVVESDAPLERRFLSAQDGQLYLTLNVDGQNPMRVSYSLSGELHLYYVLIIALLMIELIRMGFLLHRGEHISRRPLKPLSDIAATARRLSASNLSERIEARGAQGELLDLTQVLNEMLDRIEAAYNSQRQFVSDASHELRTPLSVIQGYADMLSRWGKTDPSVCDESIAAIQSEVAGMKELVEQLLFIARHDNRTHQYEMDYFDASDMLEETLRETQMIAEKHTVRAGVVQRVIVYGDRSAIKQALRVFVDNALKYTPEGGVIELSCQGEEDYCRISVVDNGIGVDESELPLIFERFYRADTARSGEVDGHGLGLSIARLIVRAHQGKIEVESKKGVGSRFHILLRR